MYDILFLHFIISSNKLVKFKRLFFSISGILFVLFLTITGYYLTRFLRAQSSCLTREQVQQDNRCLYIYNTMIFEKGTRTSPHKGHACGMDVTSIIPQSHLLDKVGYLDPNYRGELCSSQPTQTPTPSLTPIPNSTATPQPSQTPTIPSRPTNTPILQPNPTETPQNPTNLPSATSYMGNNISPTINPSSQLPISGQEYPLVSLVSSLLIIVSMTVLLLK